MENIALDILENYGVLGLLMMSILFVIVWLTKFIDKKDSQVAEICSRFSDSLDANTKAFNELCVREYEIKTSNENVKKEIHELRKENTRDHGMMMNVVMNKNCDYSKAAAKA